MSWSGFAKRGFVFVTVRGSNKLEMASQTWISTPSKDIVHIHKLGCYSERRS